MVLGLSPGMYSIFIDVPAIDQTGRPRARPKSPDARKVIGLRLTAVVEPTVGTTVPEVLTTTAPYAPLLSTGNFMATSGRREAGKVIAAVDRTPPVTTPSR
jgi:hypothetical protein